MDDLPASRPFYANADNVIRGWATMSLSLRIRSTTGPSAVAIWRWPAGSGSAAVFTDSGNALDPQYLEQWEQSVGLGVRRLSPMGQIRLDLAFALTKGDRREERDGPPPARLRFVIGSHR